MVTVGTAGAAQFGGLPPPVDIDPMAVCSQPQLPTIFSAIPYPLAAMGTSGQGAISYLAGVGASGWF